MKSPNCRNSEDNLTNKCRNGFIHVLYWSNSTGHQDKSLLYPPKIIAMRTPWTLVASLAMSQSLLNYLDDLCGDSLLG